MNKYIYLLGMAVVGLTLSVYGLKKGPNSLSDIFMLFNGESDVNQTLLPAMPVNHLDNQGYLNATEICPKLNSIVNVLTDDFKQFLNRQSPINTQFGQFDFTAEKLTFIENHFAYYQDKKTGLYYLSSKKNHKVCTASKLLLATNILFTRLSGQSKEYVSQYFKNSGISLKLSTATLLRDRFLLTFNKENKLINFTLQSFEEMVRLEQKHNTPYVALR